jgi:hypothetical protein
LLILQDATMSGINPEAASAGNRAGGPAAELPPSLPFATPPVPPPLPEDDPEFRVVVKYAELKLLWQLFAAETEKAELEARSAAEERERLDATSKQLNSARVAAYRCRKKLAESQQEVARLMQTSMTDSANTSVEGLAEFMRVH